MTNLNINSAENKAKAARTRLLRSEKKAASLTHLEGGAKTYLDTLPGIGVVLEFPSKRKCYFANPQMAVDYWYRKYAYAFGTFASGEASIGPLVEAKVEQGYRTITYKEWAEPGFTMDTLKLAAVA